MWAVDSGFANRFVVYIFVFLFAFVSYIRIYVQNIYANICKIWLETRYFWPKLTIILLLLSSIPSIEIHEDSPQGLLHGSVSTRQRSQEYGTISLHCQCWQ